MADAESLFAELAQAGAERHIETLQRRRPHLVGVDAVRHEDSGQRIAVVVGMAADGFQAPGLDRLAGCLAMAPVAAVDGIQAFGQQQLEGHFQAVQQIGRRRVGEDAFFVGGDDRFPVPIGFRQACRPGRVAGFLADHVEAHARRQHQALLRTADRNVDPPALVVVGDGAQRRDAVDQQQGRVGGRIQRPAQGFDVAHGGRRGFVVDDADGLDGVAAVLFEDFLSPARRGGGAPVARLQHGVEAEGPGNARPQPGEMAGLEGQHPVPR